MTRFPKPSRRVKPRKPVKRRVRPRPQRKGKRAAQMRELDRLWAASVRAKWEGKCLVCMKPATDAAHIVSRRYAATRWLLANGVPLCRKCHVYYTARPAEWAEFIAFDMPTLYGWLCDVAQRGGKPDLAAVKAALEAA